MSRIMKDSGIEWIGEIPQHWEIAKIQYLFAIGRGRVIAKTELVENGIYPVYSSQTFQNGCMGYLNTYDFDSNQLTWTTDGANAGTVFLRKGKYNCTNVCGTLLPKTDLLNMNYIYHALSYIALYHKRYDTNGFKIMNNEMSKINVLLPYLSEQEKIANYLDNKCAELDKTIENQKSTIEKLKEYKQSLITETVTKGLNPDARMKDSGIEWIGKIPQHWEVTQISKFFHVILGKMLASSPQSLDDTLENYLCSLNIKLSGVDCKKVKKMYFSAKEKQQYLLKKGDILLTEGGSIGETCIYNNEAYPCYIQNSVYKIFTKNQKAACNKWGYYTIVLVKILGYLDSICNKATIAHYTKKKVCNTPMLLAPIQEQEEIVEYLDRKCTEIDKTIEKKQELISKLSEYKKSLIFECVTGKKEII